MISRRGKNIYSLSEIAPYSPYSADYLRIRILQGKLRGLKIGREWHTSHEWLQEYINKFATEKILLAAPERVRLSLKKSEGEFSYPYTIRYTDSSKSPIETGEIDKPNTAKSQNHEFYSSTDARRSPAFRQFASRLSRDTRQAFFVLSVTALSFLTVFAVVRAERSPSKIAADSLEAIASFEIADASNLGAHIFFRAARTPDQLGAGAEHVISMGRRLVSNAYEADPRESLAFAFPWFSRLSDRIAGLFGLSTPAPVATEPPSETFSPTDTSVSDPNPTPMVMSAPSMAQEIVRVIERTEVIREVSPPPQSAPYSDTLPLIVNKLVSDVAQLYEGSPSPRASLASFAHSQSIDILTGVVARNGLTVDTGDFVVDENGSIGGSLAVVGNVSTQGSLSASGDLGIAGTGTSTFAGSIDVASGAQFTGNITINGSAVISGGSINVGDKVIAPGDIGAGTSTPGGKLSVQNTDGSRYAFLLYGATTSQTANLFGIFDNPTSNSPALIVSAGGNVGVGTSAPASLFAVAGRALFGAAGATSTNIGAEDIRQHLRVSSLEILGSCKGCPDTVAAGNSGNIQYNNGSGAFTANSLFTFDGTNLGVGTATPGAMLAVHGPALINGTTTAMGGLLTPSISATGTLGFYTAGAAAPRVVIDASGNVGIGTTRPATNSLEFADDYSLGGPFGQWRIVDSGNGQLDIWAAGAASAQSIRLTGNGAQTYTAQTGAGANGDAFVFNNAPGAVLSGRFNMRVQEAGTTVAGVLSGGGAYFAGNVGIGTTTPGALFSVHGPALINGTTTAMGGLIAPSISATSSLGIYTGVVDYRQTSTTTIPNGIVNAFSFATTTSALRPAFSIDTANDFLGIGTIGPKARLHIYGRESAPELRLESGAVSGQPVLKFFSSNTTQSVERANVLVNGSNDLVLRTLSTNGNGIDFQTSSVSRMYVSSGGLVGIGTSTPGALLSVHGPALINGTTTAMGGLITPSISATGTLGLYTGGGAAPRVAIDTSGNVGIGTTNPENKFQVVGQAGTGSTGVANITGYDQFGQNLTLQVPNGGYTGNLFMVFKAAGSSGQAMGLGVRFENDSAKRFLFTDPSGNERFSILESGNVGVGETAPGSKLSVSGGGSFGAGYDTTAAPTNGLIIEGNVGIGTTTPGAMLSVHGPALINGTTTAMGGLITPSISATGTLGFYAGGNAAPSVLINASGNVGIGTVNPAGILTIEGAGTKEVQITSTNNNSEIRFTGNNILRGYVGSISGDFGIFDDALYPAVIVRSGGNVGIGTTSPWRSFSVNGKAAFTGLTNDGTGYYVCLNTTTYDLATSTTACGASSIRFKENVTDLPYGLAEVGELRPVSFDWKKGFMANGTHQIGFIAEEVMDIIPEVIGYDEEGNVMNLDYPKLTAVLTKAVQELNAKVDSALSSGLASIASGQTNAWAVDQTTGKVNVNFFGDLNLQGNAIYDIQKIIGTHGTWKIGEDGTLVIQKIETSELEVGSQEKPNGITLYDPTGEPYCVKVEIGGTLVSAPGKCTAVNAIPPANTQGGTPPPPTASTPPSAGDDQPPSVETPEDSVSEPTQEPVSPPSSETAPIPLPLDNDNEPTPTPPSVEPGLAPEE